MTFSEWEAQIVIFNIQFDIEVKNSRYKSQP
jgi:hypothetical protein